ncbi:MAG TPA: hypothetical protein VJ548_01730 [Azospira sp.]|nr:hypothetical protein [Azospira sp.]
MTQARVAGAGRGALVSGILVGAVVLIYALLAHYTSATPEGGQAWAVALALAPLLLIGLGLARQGGPWVLGLSLVAAVPLLAWAWPRLLQHVGGIYLIQNVGINASLGLYFGRTLAAGQEPLCTTFAAMINPQVTPAVRRYTRQVTAAWTIFFGSVVTISCLLYVFAPIAVWSVFANLLTWPLVGLMFLAEYLVRCRVLPPEDRGGIFAAIGAYRENSKQRSQQRSRQRAQENAGQQQNNGANQS